MPRGGSASPWPGSCPSNLGDTNCTYKVSKSFESVNGITSICEVLGTRTAHIQPFMLHSFQNNLKKSKFHAKFRFFFLQKSDTIFEEKNQTFLF